MEEKTKSKNTPKKNVEIAQENTENIGVERENIMRGNNNKISTSNILLAIVAVLVIMSGIQVFQTQKLLNSVANGTIKTSTPIQGSATGLPSQVGGCG